MPSKAVELRELPDDDLYVRIESAKEELFNLRFQLATGQLDNTARLKELRHDVARVMTVPRGRALEAGAGGAPAGPRAPGSRPRRGSRTGSTRTPAGCRARRWPRCSASRSMRRPTRK